MAHRKVYTEKKPLTLKQRRLRFNKTHKTHSNPTAVCTCKTCKEKVKCRDAYDLYNIGGDCLPSK